MREIARLRKTVYVEQVNIRIEPKLKERIQALKHNKGVDVAEEARKALEAMVESLEKAVG